MLLRNINLIVIQQMIVKKYLLMDIINHLIIHYHQLVVKKF